MTVNPGEKDTLISRSTGSFAPGQANDAFFISIFVLGVKVVSSLSGSFMNSSRRPTETLAFKRTCLELALGYGYGGYKLTVIKFGNSRKLDTSMPNS